MWLQDFCCTQSATYFIINNDPSVAFIISVWGYSWWYKIQYRLRTQYLVSNGMLDQFLTKLLTKLINLLHIHLQLCRIFVQWVEFHFAIVVALEWLIDIVPCNHYICTNIMNVNLRHLLPLHVDDLNITGCTTGLFKTTLVICLFLIWTFILENDAPYLTTMQCIRYPFHYNG